MVVIPGLIFLLHDKRWKTPAVASSKAKGWPLIVLYANLFMYNIYYISLIVPVLNKSKPSADLNVYKNRNPPVLFPSSSSLSLGLCISVRSGTADFMAQLALEDWLDHQHLKAEVCSVLPASRWEPWYIAGTLFVQDWYHLKTFSDL